MPVTCPGGGKPRFRRKGKMRLAFCGSEVVESKNMQTGAIHTQAEFKADKAKRKAKERGLGSK